MSEIRFFDIRRADWPGEVVQCNECCALVLDCNTVPHADWHESLRAVDATVERLKGEAAKAGEVS